jgi:hypothetical protein
MFLWLGTYLYLRWPFFLMKHSWINSLNLSFICFFFTPAVENKNKNRGGRGWQCFSTPLKRMANVDSNTYYMKGQILFCNKNKNKNKNKTLWFYETDNINMIEFLNDKIFILFASHLPLKIKIKTEVVEVDNTFPRLCWMKLWFLT